MTQTNVIANKLVWQNDQSAAQSTIAVNKQVGDSLAAIRKQADADYEARVRQLGQISNATRTSLAADRALYDADYQARVDRLTAIATQTQQGTAALTVQARQVQNLSDLYKALDDQAKGAQTTIRDIGLQNNALPDPALGAFAGETAAGGSGIGSSIRSVRQAAIALPGVGFQSPLVVGLRGVEAIADKTGASLLELGAAGGIAAVAVVAVVAAMAHFNEGLQAAKVRLDGALAAEKNYYDALGTLTTEQVQKQIDTLKQQQTALQQKATELNNALTAQFQQDSSGIGGQLSGMVQEKLGATPFNQLKTASDEANKALQENTDTITRLTQGLNSNAFAANDAADAEKKLAAAREKIAEQLATFQDQDAQQRQQLSSLRRTGTVDQVNELLAADKDRETLLRNDLIPGVKTLGLSEEAATARSQALTTELQHLTDQDTLLLQSVLPVVSAREAEIALLKAQKDASDALNPILQDINKAQVDLGNASQKTADALAAVGQASVDHQNNLIDIQTQYDTAQRDALDKKNKALAKIDQQAAERQLQQRENDNLSILQAIARGDIASAQATLAAQKVKTEQDKRQIDQQKADAEQSYQDALKAANDQHAKLLKAEQDRYTKELAQRRDAYNKAFQDEQALSARLQSLRSQEAFQRQYNANVEAAALAKVSTATGAFASQMQSYAASINSWISSGGAAWHSVGGSGGSSAPGTISTPGVISTPGAGPGGLPPVTGTGASKRTLTSYALGTPYVPENMLAFIHKGERIIPAGQNGIPSVSFQIDARGSTISEAEWQRRLEPVKVEVVQKLTALHNSQKH